MKDEGKTKVDRQPCGCAVATKPNGKKIFSPCVPCGLYRVALMLSEARSWWRRGRSLENAAQALAAVASTIHRETKSRAAAMAAVQSLTEGKKNEEAN